MVTVQVMRIWMEQRRVYGIFRVQGRRLGTDHQGPGIFFLPRHLFLSWTVTYERAACVNGALVWSTVSST